VSTIGEELTTNSIRKWEREVAKLTRGVSSYREQLQTIATDLARASVMGDPILHLSCEVATHTRCVFRAERSLESAVRRLAFYRNRLKLETGN
jgi:hypothetical protein